MFPVTHLLRLVLLLLVPLWLSLGAEALGIRLPFANLLSDWMQARPPVDPALVPPPGWREATYLDANPDIAAAVRGGLLPSGYAHYIRYGRSEGRPGGLSAGRPPEAAAEPQTPAQTEPPHPGGASGKSQEEPTGTGVSVPVAAIAASPVAPPAVPPAVPPSAAPNASVTVPEPPAVKPPAPPVAGRPQPAAPLPASKPSTGKPAAPHPQGELILVSGLRTGAGNGAIRVVLDLDRPPRFETPVSRPDGSLTITLPGTVWKTSPSGRLPAVGWGYRAESSDETSRLTVLDGEGGPVAVKTIFAMPPDGERSHRLVIDLIPPQTAGSQSSSKAKPAARTATADRKRT